MGYACAAYSLGWTNSCNQKAVWVEHNYCQYTCWEHGVGYGDAECCPLPPTHAPATGSPTEAPTTQPTDTPTSGPVKTASASPTEAPIGPTFSPTAKLTGLPTRGVSALLVLR